MEKFSQRLNYACDLAGLPPINKGRQTYLANLMSVSNEAVRKWLSDETTPRRDKSDELCRMLRVNSAWLYLGVGEPTSVNIPHIDLALIDQFAIHALNAILNSTPDIDEQTLARKSYSIARLMLIEKSRVEE